MTSIIGAIARKGKDLQKEGIQLRKIRLSPEVYRDMVEEAAAAGLLKGASATTLADQLLGLPIVQDDLICNAREAFFEVPWKQGLFYRIPLPEETK